MRFCLLIITGIYTTFMSAARSLRRDSMPNSNNNSTDKFQPTNQTDHAVLDFWTAFAAIHDDTVWPAPHSNNTSFISSTFGFRKKASCHCNDFHRGIDIHGEIGDPVLASYHGKVKTVMTYKQSGNKIIVLEHKFDQNVSFHDKNISKWYTHYFHLDEQLVAQGDIVAAGDLVGRVGATGVLTGTPHLHQEVRLGTPCSLEYALDHTDSICNRLGFDPHVHPLFLYPPNKIKSSLSLSIALTLQQNVTRSRDSRIRVTTPDDLAIVNRYKVQIQDMLEDGGSMIRKSHVLDYNLRIGFHPNSVQELDTVDTTRPYLKTFSFGHVATEWKIDLIIPTSWVVVVGGSNKAPPARNEVLVVTVSNIWQEATTLIAPIG